MGKIGRNAPCPCGNGKKYKYCHGNPLNPQNAKKSINPARIEAMIEQHKAKELTRVKQQGLGRPIIATDFNEHKIVAVGNTIHFSKNCRIS